MNTQPLIDLANERGITLEHRQAKRLLETKAEHAEHVITAAAALIDLASAIGKDMDVNHAIQRIVVCYAAGATDDQVFEIAADRLLEPVRRRKSYVFRTEYERFERLFFGDEAKARHAVFVGNLIDGSLGYQASMLLIAAEDAGLPAADYRAKLTRWTGDAINRLYPVHDEPMVRVRDQDTPTTRHDDVLARVRREEQTARELAAGKVPDLAARIDRLHDRRLKRDVRRLLNTVRRELARRRDEGWIADPESYELHVLQPAAEATRRAA